MTMFDVVTTFCVEKGLLWIINKNILPCFQLQQPYLFKLFEFLELGLHCQYDLFLFSEKKEKCNTFTGLQIVIKFSIDSENSCAIQRYLFNKLVFILFLFYFKRHN